MTNTKLHRNDYVITNHVNKRTNPDFNGNTLNALIDVLRSRVSINSDYAQTFYDHGYYLIASFDGVTPEPKYETNPYIVGLIDYTISLLKLELNERIENANRYD